MITKHRIPIVLAGALLALAYGVSAPARSQPKQDAWEVLLAYDKDQKPLADPRIAVRPNVTQTVFVYLKNKSPALKKNVSLTLVYVAGRETSVVAQAALEKIGPDQVGAIPFKAVPPPKDAPPPKGEGPAPLPGPPFHFQIWVEEGKKEIIKLDVPLTIQQPSEYVSAQAHFDRVKNRLGVTLKGDPAALNILPPAKVNLVLDRTEIPGLLPTKEGTLLGELKGPNAEAELFVSGLNFVKGIPPKQGRVFLGVDDFDRAFIFQATFEGGNLQRLPSLNRVRLVAPRYFVPKLPDAKDPKVVDKPDPRILMSAVLEVDGDLNQDARVEIALDRVGDGNFVPLTTFPSMRLQQLTVAPGAPGTLLCKTVVKDWPVELDVTGVVGRRTLRVRLLDARDKALPVADESVIPLFSRDVLINPFAPLRFDELDRAVYAEVLIDPTGPEGVRFVGLPAKTYVGAKLVLRAAVNPRDPKLQAPIASVQFVVGDPKKDQPLPAVFDKASNTWAAAWTVPLDAKDSVGVGVEMKTETGASVFVTEKMAVSLGGSSELTRITGRVSWNGFAQAGIEVKLLDEKGADVQKKNASVKGVYLFDDLKPGAYGVVAAKIGFKGAGKATVAKGQTVELNITLDRTAK